MTKRFEYWKLFFLSYKNWGELLIGRVFKTHVEKIRLRNGLKILGRDISPLSVMVDEIFLLQKYTPDNFDIKKGDIVVDIGANVGVFSLLAASRGASHIYSYEPDIESFKMIKKNAEINKFKKISAKNSAVTDKKGSVKLYLKYEDGGNTVTPNNQERESLPFQTITSLKLEDIFKNQKIEKIDFLKIDCEGSEGLIVKSTSKNVWEKIGKIAMEYHDNASILSHSEISKILKKTGFDVAVKEDGNGFGYLYASRNS